MNLITWPKILYSPLLLIALMLLTRFHHFGSAVSLPDASLAVFFLAGFWFASKRLFIFLLAQAAVIDYVAITQMDVSDYCISPAYVFLIPTYAVMWLAGRYAQHKTMSMLTQISLLILATTTAFIISSGGFYLGSGKFETLAAVDYIKHTVPYFSAYLSTTFIYSVVIIAVVKVLAHTLKMDASQTMDSVTK